MKTKIKKRGLGLGLWSGGWIKDDILTMFREEKVKSMELIFIWVRKGK